MDLRPDSRIDPGGRELEDAELQDAGLGSDKNSSTSDPLGTSLVARSFSLPAVCLGVALWVFAALVFLQGSSFVTGRSPGWVVSRGSELEANLPGLEALVDLQDRARIVGRTVAPSVVGIEAGANRGSGVIVSADGLILTAAHVFERPNTRVKIYLANGRQVDGVGIGLNSRADAGYIRIEDPAPKGGYPFAELAGPHQLSVGDWCLAFGHPGGYRRDRLAVMRLGSVRYLGDLLVRTDAAIQSGDSGGPLFNIDGQLVGIHSRIFSQLSANFHVPIEAYFDRWPEIFESPASTPFLGVELAEHPRGCEIQEVIAGFGAEVAGFRKGDIIESIDGVSVRGIRDLKGALSGKVVGETVKIGFRRQSDTAIAKAVLSPRPRNGVER